MLPIRTILHPTDFSERARYALQLACALARDQGAHLTLLHVMPVPLAQEKMRYREEMEGELNRTEVPDPSVSVERRLEEGDPATQILGAAQEGGCDLIVLGTHGRTGLDRLLMGSVAEQVVRRAPCPVLTVRIPFPQAKPGGTSPAEERGRPPGAPST
jgi:nucleotide-binding universal stress UspA family protein